MPYKIIAVPSQGMSPKIDPALVDAQLLAWKHNLGDSLVVIDKFIGSLDSISSPSSEAAIQVIKDKINSLTDRSYSFDVRYRLRVIAQQIRLNSKPLDEFVKLLAQFLGTIDLATRSSTQGAPKTDFNLPTGDVTSIAIGANIHDLEQNFDLLSRKTNTNNDAILGEIENAMLPSVRGIPTSLIKLNTSGDIASVDEYQEKVMAVHVDDAIAFQGKWSVSEKPRVYAVLLPKGTIDTFAIQIPEGCPTELSQQHLNKGTFVGKGHVNIPIGDSHVIATKFEGSREQVNLKKSIYIQIDGCVISQLDFVKSKVIACVEIDPASKQVIAVKFFQNSQGDTSVQT